MVTLLVAEVSFLNGKMTYAIVLRNICEDPMVLRKIDHHGNKDPLHFNEKLYTLTTINNRYVKIKPFYYLIFLNSIQLYYKLLH